VTVSINLKSIFLCHISLTLSLSLSLLYSLHHFIRWVSTFLYSLRKRIRRNKYSEFYRWKQSTNQTLSFTFSLSFPPKFQFINLSYSPFNSWDRDPYLITDPITGQVTTTKAYDVLSKNFIIANYNSLGSVDNDDGSSWYISRNNFFVYGGGG
jgi:hypothetical protein